MTSGQPAPEPAPAPSIPAPLIPAPALTPEPVPAPAPALAYPAPAPIPVVPPATDTCNGTYGEDCSCESNLPELLVKLAPKPTATCSNGVWTVSSTINLGIEQWDFKSDSIVVNGDFTSSLATILTISVNTTGTPPSFHLTCKNIQMGGELYVNLLDGTVGDHSTEIVKFATYDSSAIYTLNAPTLPSAYKLCRSFVNNPGIFVNGTYGAVFLDVSLTTNLFNCVTGKGDRTWVLALMILSGIHVALLLLFCLVTCKNADLYPKVWE